MMNMPGFRGEKSLYTSRAQSSAIATEFSAGRTKIRPQLAPSGEYRRHLATLYRGLSDAFAARNCSWLMSTREG